MNYRRFPFTPKIIIPFAVLVAVLTLCMPRVGEFEYHYGKGTKWNYETLVAPFDFPILKTEQQLDAERGRLGNTFVPYYNFSETVAGELCGSVRSSLRGNELLAASLCAALDSLYERGVLPDTFDAVTADENLPAPGIVFVQRNKRAVKTPVSELYTLSQVKTLLPQMLQRVYHGAQVDSILAKSAALDQLKPNLTFDKQTTDQVRAESAEFISPTSGMFRAGDVIISSGEIVTSDIAQILDSYKAEFRSNVGYNGPSYLLWGGNFLLALLLPSLLVCLLWFSRPGLLGRINEYLFILTVFLISCIATFVFSRFPAGNMIYMMPYPVFALYYMAFYRKRLVLPVYTMCLLPILLFCQGGVHIFFMFLLSGFVAVCAFQRFNRGWQQFVTASMVFLAMLAAYTMFRLVGGSIRLFNIYDVLYMFLGSFFCVLAYPLVYLFEIIFSLVSASRLLELADTGNPLLRTLAEKAPGTFQHSLAVMNMCESAARSIDADVPLVRAASMYHDIGKIMNPQCFVENNNGGPDYHENLGCRESAIDIIHHVQDGLALAEKHNIPQVVRDFIACHHGTTTTGYFYTKYLNEGGDPSAVADFTYPGPLPVSKEQVILMLCDALEAASRTLKDFSAESVGSFVEKICSDKSRAGQFDSAGISMRELDTVKQTLKSYIVQVHHGRIAYPKRKNNSK